MIHKLSTPINSLKSIFYKIEDNINKEDQALVE